MVLGAVAIILVSTYLGRERFPLGSGPMADASTAFFPGWPGGEDHPDGAVFPGRDELTGRRVAARAARHRGRYSDLSALEAGQFRTAPLVLGWTDQLEWERQTPLSLVIASGDLSSAKEELARGPAPPTNVVVERAKIGERVRAELTGPNVRITAPEQTTRDVPPGANVTFTWMVEPTTPNPTTLMLRVYNEVRTRDGYVEVERPAYRHTFSVKISRIDQFIWMAEKIDKAKTIAVSLAAFGIGMILLMLGRRGWSKWIAP